MEIVIKMADKISAKYGEKLEDTNKAIDFSKQIKIDSSNIEDCKIIIGSFLSAHYFDLAAGNFKDNGQGGLYFNDTNVVHGLIPKSLDVVGSIGIILHASSPDSDYVVFIKDSLTINGDIMYTAGSDNDSIKFTKIKEIK